MISAFTGINYGWFPVRITAKTGSGASARYSWVRRWVEPAGTVGNMPGVASGDSGGDLAGVSLTGDDLSVGDDALARPAPGAGGTLYELMPAGGGGGGGNAAEQDCGSLVGANANSCLRADIEAGPGNCDGIANATVDLEFDTDRWAAEIDTGRGCTTLNFIKGNTTTFGQPIAWLTGFTATDDDSEIPDTYLTLADCAGGTLTYRGSEPICTPPDGAGECTGDCPPSSFSVSIYCISCVNEDFDGAGWYCTSFGGDCGSGNQTCVYYSEDPGRCVTLCSGPYEEFGNCTCASPPPPPLSVGCCEDPVAGRLYATFANGTGELAALNDLTVPIDSTGVFWQSDLLEMLCDGGGASRNIRVRLECYGAGWDIFRIGGPGNCGFESGNVESGLVPCPPDPLFIEFTGVVGNCGADTDCIHDDTIDITISETPP